MEDKIDLARLYEDIKGSIPEGSTHFVLTWASQRNAGMWRLSDGMYLGEAGDKTVVYGENPNKRESRLFISHAHARRFLFEVVPAEESASVKVFDLDIESHMLKNSLLVMPNSKLSLIVNGSENIDGQHPLANNVRKLN